VDVVVGAVVAGEAVETSLRFAVGAVASAADEAGGFGGSGGKPKDSSKFGFGAVADAAPDVDKSLGVVDGVTPVVSKTGDTAVDDFANGAAGGLISFGLAVIAARYA
jgi:hypothetical protein